MKIHPFHIFSDSIQAEVLQGDVMNEVPYPVQWMEQVHGAELAVIEELGETAPGVDAMITQTKGVRLLVKTADCIPLVFADEEAGVIAAVHAGWRSLVADIIPKTIEKLLTMGADPSRIKVGIGPNLGSCCSRFSDPTNEIPERYHWAIRWEGGEFDSAHVNKSEEAHPKKPGIVNLRAIRDQQLSDAGIKLTNIESMDVCTACSSGSNGQDGQWPSWRKVQTKKRFGTTIMLRS